MKSASLVAPPCSILLAAREARAGKSLARTMMNAEIARRVHLRGRVLDLGAGDRPSYWRFVQKPASLVTVDIDVTNGPSLVASLESGVPLTATQFDVVLAFNVFEHVYAGETLARDITRVLKPGGKLYCSVPFLVPIHADPYDFFRYTGWALSALFHGAGLMDVEVYAYGGYFAALAEHLNRVTRVGLLRSAIAAGGLALDRLMDRATLAGAGAGRFVIGYFLEARRP